MYDCFSKFYSKEHNYQCKLGTIYNTRNVPYYVRRSDEAGFFLYRFQIWYIPTNLDFLQVAKKDLSFPWLVKMVKNRALTTKDILFESCFIQSKYLQDFRPTSNITASTNRKLFWTKDCSCSRHSKVAPKYQISHKYDQIKHGPQVFLMVLNNS